MNFVGSADAKADNADAVCDDKASTVSRVDATTTEDEDANVDPDVVTEPEAVVVIAPDTEL